MKYINIFKGRLHSCLIFVPLITCAPKSDYYSNHLILFVRPRLPDFPFVKHVKEEFVFSLESRSLPLNTRTCLQAWKIREQSWRLIVHTNECSHEILNQRHAIVMCVWNLGYIITLLIQFWVVKLIKECCFVSFDALFCKENMLSVWRISWLSIYLLCLQLTFI